MRLGWSLPPTVKLCPPGNSHGVQLFADAQVTLHVALERSVVDSAGLCIRETLMEQYFPATTTFGANSEDVIVGSWKDHVRNRFGLRVVVKNDVANVSL